MKTINILIAFILLTGHLQAEETWDILDKSMAAWNADGGSPVNRAWNLTKATQGSIPASAVTQQDGYVNIMKTYTRPSYNYAFLTPPVLTLSTGTTYSFEVEARVRAIDKTDFPDQAPPGSGEGGYESNQISARLLNKSMSIHLKYGDDGNGYLTLGSNVTHGDAEKRLLNTAEWHRYRIVLHADNLHYDVYVDDDPDPVFADAATMKQDGTNILRLGAETNHRCNLDIRYVKMATGDPRAVPKITSVSVTSDSHIAGGNHPPVTLTAHTTLIANGEKLQLTLLNAAGTAVADPAEITVGDNLATAVVDLPVSLPVGKYTLRVTAPNGAPKSVPYVVVDRSPIDAKLFPQVKPVGWAVADMDDYQYKNTSNEFIFPSIVDVTEHTADGHFLNTQAPLARYYLFYAPHENPGGMYLATAPTLDGPWTERGIVMSLNWAHAIPDNVINTATHISACHVVWNDLQNKYFMYFHGPNSTTHYAHSDNLVDWTFGASVVNSRQFSPNGAEASYAKVFEHTIPALGNKYVLLLMNQEGQIRRIYWAHSTDGVHWTPIRQPLVSPDLPHKKIPGTDSKPNYSGNFGTDYGNVAAPYLIRRDGRTFVLCHGSSGNMFVVEVGESFDMEVHWGVYLHASDVVIDTDASGHPQAVPRIASPQFIRDDGGRWYMFFEAGSRLGANIAYAREDVSGSAIAPSPAAATVAVYPSIVDRGGNLTIHVATAGDLSVEIMDVSGKIISAAKIAASLGDVRAPETAGVYFVRVNRTGTAKIIVQ